MAQRANSPHPLSPDFNHRVVPFPTRYVPFVPAEPPAASELRGLNGGQLHTRKKVIRQVAVLEVTGLLREVASDLDQAIQLALAEGPRGVVCDLSGPLVGTDPVAVELLATAGRHVRDWPGIPVAVACPDPQVREALGAHPLGRHLIVAESMFLALSAVLSTCTQGVARLALAAHPTAPRASREFVRRTLLDLGLSRLIPFATLMVSELVASSSVHAGTDIDVTLTFDREVLRLTVRDHGPALAGQQSGDHDLHGRGLSIVGGLSRAFGVLPAADGGKLVWAVLEAPVRPSPSNGVGKLPRRPAQDASTSRRVRAAESSRNRAATGSSPGP
jgi:anti-sigma regulatory factor (Ser/Thr protein kinase)